MSSGRSRRGDVLAGQSQPSPWHLARTGRVVVLIVILLTVGWLALVFLADPIRFVVFAPRAKTGFEVFLAIGQLFGAVVLALAPADPGIAWRMRWVAAGFVALGLGALGYGYLYPLLTDAPHLSVTMYGSLYTRAMGTLLVAIGLLPTVAPRVRRDHVLVLTMVVMLGGVLLAAVAESLPPLVRIAGMSVIIDHSPALDIGTAADHAHLSDVERIVSGARTVFPGLTVWHWGVSLIPLAVAVGGVWGAWNQHQRRPLSTWLLVAIVLLAGAQLHSLFWPSMYSSILTTTSVLRLGMAIVVIAGGILELRRVVDERAVLLAAERERVARMEELAALKADFTSIVAHELASPLAAITMMGEMLATGALSTRQGKEVGERILGEARLLQLLVTDVRASSDVERDDFHVQPRRTRVTSLLAGVETFARTLPMTHPVTVEPAPVADVLVDPDRVGQVLRNLLTNAIRHTPEGTPIVVRASRDCGHIRIEVSDRGPGIALEDRTRIFEKFGRGREATRHQTPGRGLGLYLSRRILQAHGRDLEFGSTPGQGTTFGFTLEEAP